MVADTTDSAASVSSSPTGIANLSSNADDLYNNFDVGTLYQSGTFSYQDDYFTLVENHNVTSALNSSQSDSTSSEHYLDSASDESSYKAKGNKGSSSNDMYNYTQAEDMQDDYTASGTTFGPNAGSAAADEHVISDAVEVGGVGGPDGVQFNISDCVSSDYSGHYDSRHGTAEEKESFSGDHSFGDVITSNPYNNTPFVVTSFDTMFPSGGVDTEGYFNYIEQAVRAAGADTSTLGGTGGPAARPAGAVAYLGGESPSVGGTLASALGSRGAMALNAAGPPIHESQQNNGSTISYRINNGASGWIAAPANPGYRRLVAGSGGGGGGGGPVGPDEAHLYEDGEGLSNPSGTSGTAAGAAAGEGSPTQGPQNQTPLQPAPVPLGEGGFFGAFGSRFSRELTGGWGQSPATRTPSSTPTTSPATPTAPTTDPAASAAPIAQPSIGADGGQRNLLDDAIDLGVAVATPIAQQLVGADGSQRNLVDDAIDATAQAATGYADGSTSDAASKIQGGLYGDAAAANQSGPIYDAARTLGSIGAFVTGFANPCSLGATAGTAARVLGALDAASNASDALDAYNRGDTFGAATSGLGALGGLAQFLSSCFAAGTPIVTPDGWRAIDELRVGDWVLSLPEDDVEATPEPRRVVAVF